MPGPRPDGRVEMAFLEPARVLICGSTLFACDLAVRLARVGMAPVLVMERVNPFFEGISCLRSWFDRADVGHAVPLLGELLGNASLCVEKEGRLYFNAMKAALEIEDRLAEAGVRFLYNAPVAGALAQEGRLCGAVFGGKTGLFAIEAEAVVDATPEATVARACGAVFTKKAGPVRVHYVADLSAPVPPRRTAYRSAAGVPVEAELHHYFARFAVTLEQPSTGPFAESLDFERAYAAALECPFEGGEKRFRGADGFLSSGTDKLESADGSVAGFPNLLVFGPHGMPGNAEGSLVLEDTRVLFKAFPDAVARVEAACAKVPRGAGGDWAFWNRAVECEAGSGLGHSFLDPGFSESGSQIRPVKFEAPRVVLKAEVLVVGGGTSGNAATYGSAVLGLRTLCVERGLELGGTNTLGGVTNLWFGKKTRAFEQYYDAVGARNDGLNAPGFFRGVKRAGASVLFQSAVTGVAREGRRVERVYVITARGLAAVAAPRIIEATGDGSVAAWAGCGYTFGGIHDEMTLWGSFACYTPGRPEALRPFLSPCDERSALDATRFILAMRRNASPLRRELPHVLPPFYLAPRESRHLEGGRTLTFLDVLAGRRFRDGVFRVESNPDIKGLATSDAAKAGFIPTDWKKLYQATVPYPAMIPAAIDNVIVAGKAYSATHDALSVARMQRDLCVMGLVASEAVRISIRRGVLLRDVPVGELQAVLIEKQMLQASDIAPDDLGFGRTPEQMAREVAATEDYDRALTPSAQLCLLPREVALAALEPHADSRRGPLRRLLAYLGHPKGVLDCLQSAGAALGEGALSTEVFGGQGTKHVMPDQGYAPLAALQLGALAHRREAGLVPLLCRLGSRLPVDAIELRHGWGYFYALACGFERVPSPEGVPVLERLLDGPVFRTGSVSRRGDLRACMDYMSERLVYLRMALARALLRCGGKRGAMELCGLLDEARACFARAARAELVAAFGRDHAFDVERWKAEIAGAGPGLNPLQREFL